MNFSRVLTHSLSLQKWRHDDILGSWYTSVSMWILNKVMWAAAWPLNSQHYQDSQKQDAILQNLNSDQGTKMSRTLLTTNWPICTSQGTMMPGPQVPELCARLCTSGLQGLQEEVGPFQSLGWGKHHTPTSQSRRACWSSQHKRTVFG